MDVIVSNSNRKDKRYKVMYDNKVIHFGSREGRTYIDHGDDNKKKAWLARHSKLSNFDDDTKPSFWSRWLLWHEKDIKNSMKYIGKMIDRTVVLR